MKLLTVAVETKISKMMPDKFPLIFDGWTLEGVSTHYVAIFARWMDPSVNGTLLVKLYLVLHDLITLADPIKVLIAFTPLLTEEDMSSESHKELIEYVLEIFGKDLTNVVCLVGDNCNVNKSLATLCELPLIGCAAHRFNLAVQALLAEKDNAELVQIVS